MFLVFKNEFWANLTTSHIRGGAISTDLTHKHAYYFPHVTKSGVGVMLGSYVHGTDSDRLAAMSDKRVVDEVLEGVAEVHDVRENLHCIRVRPHFLLIAFPFQMSMETARALLVDYAIKHWGHDDYAHGAFLKFHPFQASQLA